MNRSNLAGALASAVVTILASGAGAEAATPTNPKAAAWYTAGATVVSANQQVNPNERKAKNVILFVGDGMGISTVTARASSRGNCAASWARSNVAVVRASSLRRAVEDLQREPADVGFRADRHGDGDRHQDERRRDFGR